YLIGVEIAEAAVILHRQAILEQRDGRIAVGRDAARADVVTRLAAGRLDPETGDLLEQIGGRYRFLARQRGRVDPGDRIAEFGLAERRFRRTAGDDDVARRL